MPAQPLSATTTESARTLLSIRDHTSHTSYVPLSGRRIILGRAEDVDVVLDSGKVSRQHAELVKDPFDRWWVRDLASRNGTRVNGVRITEVVLQPGDILELGDFALSLCPAAPIGRRRDPSLTQEWEPLSVDQDQNHQIRSLRQCEPPQIGAAHLSAVMDFGHRLNVTQDPSERLRAVAELMLSNEFHGRSVMMLSVPRATPERAEVTWGPKCADPACVAPPVSRGVLRAVARTPEPVLATNAPRQPTQVELSMAIDVMAMTVIAAPLRFDEQTVELVYVVLDAEYGHSNWLALAAMAVKQYEQAERVWQNVEKIRQYAAVERELEKAQEIQSRLIPRQTSVPGIGLAVGFRPCYWVGGDYADVVPMADGRVLLAVADVCGKGLSAALVASGVRTIVHANVRAGKDLPSLVSELNQSLIEDLEGVSFVTMLAVAIDPKTGEYECINSGHPPAWVVGREGDVRELPSGGNPPLGLDRGPMQLQRGQISSGESLFLFTDGVTELTNPAGGMLEMDALKRAVTDLARQHPPPLPVPTLAEALTAFLDDYQHGGMAVDDRTFLLARLEAPVKTIEPRTLGLS